MHLYLATYMSCLNCLSVSKCQDDYKLEPVFIYSIHHLKSLKITSKVRIDTIIHPCGF